MTINTEVNPYLAKSVRGYWIECGKALRKFNTFVINDPRVDVTMPPVFDGVSMIKWKLDAKESEGVNKLEGGNGSGRNGYSDKKDKSGRSGNANGHA